MYKTFDQKSVPAMPERIALLIKGAKMLPDQLYVVKKDAWHNIIVSEDAKVLILENADTGRENTEYMGYCVEKPNSNTGEIL